LERWRHDSVFLSQPSPTLLLSRDYTIAAASKSHQAMVGRREQDLVGLNIFDAFPESPECEAAGVSKRFIDSVERVLRTRRSHRLSPLRYDIQDEHCPEEYVEKTWAVVNTPITDGDTIGVMVRVDDLTPLDQDLVSALRAYREVLTQADPLLPQSRIAGMDAVVAAIESYVAVATEATQLREAMRTRPTIEQAKGILMADRKCSADEAFTLLRRLSNETNVRLADVAAAVVYQRTH
jgi:hypothetical protein